MNEDDAVSNFSVFVYHPQDENGDWPEGLENRPAIFFSPANGTAFDLVADDGSDETDHRYRELMRTLVQAGFVVFGLQPEAENMNSGRRRSALACMMIWARTEWDPEGERLAEFMAAMGHSRGGGAAYLLTEDLLTGNQLPDSEEEPSLWEWEQCALATFAQRYGESANIAEFTVSPIQQNEARPFLSILSASDEDTRTQGVLAYDNRYSEALATASSTFDSFDEVALLVHGQPHRAWGGTIAAEDPIGAYYVDQFLRWQMMGEDASRRRFMDLVEANGDACAYADLPFADVEDCEDNDAVTICNWDGPNEIYYRGCTGISPLSPLPDGCVETPELVGLRRPLIRADFSQGVDLVNSDRHVVDSLDRTSGSCELTTPEDDLLLSSSEGLVTVTSEVTEDGPCVCALDHANLLAGYTGTNAPEGWSSGSGTCSDPPTYGGHCCTRTTRAMTRPPWTSPTSLMSACGWEVSSGVS